MINLENRDKRIKGFKTILEFLDKKKDKLTIIETGTMRKNSPDGDGNALLIFEEYLKSLDNDSKLYSIDINKKACEFAKENSTYINTSIINQDSIEFLRDFKEPIDLLYLDSLDFDPSNAYISSTHHLQEILAVYNNSLLKNCIVAVDDNFTDKGKGYLVKQFLDMYPNTRIINNNYMIVWEIK